MSKKKSDSLYLKDRDNHPSALSFGFVLSAGPRQLRRSFSFYKTERSRTVAAMSGETFLRIQPSELKFSFQVNKQCSCTMHLANKTDEYVAFKVKTTTPKKYSVRPNTGFVLPGSTCDVLVTMQAQREAPPDMQCKDKFLVLSVIAAHGATMKAITSERFNKEPNKVVDELKLRVVYVHGNPPSPVPEEAEEGSSPRSTELENEVRNSSYSASKSPDEPLKENSLEVSAMLSKLTEEKTSADQQNQKFRHDLEMLRKEGNNHQAGFSVTFIALVALFSFFIGLYFKKALL